MDQFSVCSKPRVWNSKNWRLETNAPGLRYFFSVSIKQPCCQGLSLPNFKEKPCQEMRQEIKFCVELWLKVLFNHDIFTGNAMMYRCTLMMSVEAHSLIFSIWQPCNVSVLFSSVRSFLALWHWRQLPGLLNRNIYR